MGFFDKEDGKSFLKFLVTLAIPFVLLAIGAVLIAAWAGPMHFFLNVGLGGRASGRMSSKAAKSQA